MENIKERIIEELKNRFFGPYTLNSVIEPIEIGSVVLQPILTIKNTHAGYFIRGYKFDEQSIEEINKFKWKKEENNIYIEIEFRDGLLSMIVQEEHGDSIQWLEIKFTIVKKE